MSIIDIDRRIILVAASFGLLMGSRIVSAFPNRPVRLIVPFAPGGTTDIIARVLQEPLSRALNSTIIVENRPGAGGATAAEQVRRAEPDGHVLLLATASTHAVNPVIFSDLPYDPVTDYAPVALLGLTPLALAVHIAVPARNVSELIDLLRREPGRHNYGSAGVGSISHLAGEWFREAAGRLDVTHVPYRGGGPALQALLAGEVTFIIETTATLAGAVRDGRVRALAVTTLSRSRAFPDLPTLHENGLSDFDASSWTMAVAPRGTAANVVLHLNVAFNQALRDPVAARRLADIGTEVVTDSTPESAAAHIRQDIARWRGVVERAGLNVTR